MQPQQERAVAGGSLPPGDGPGSLARQASEPADRNLLQQGGPGRKLSGESSGPSRWVVAAMLAGQVRPGQARTQLESECREGAIESGRAKGGPPIACCSEREVSIKSLAGWLAGWTGQTAAGQPAALVWLADDGSARPRLPARVERLMLVGLPAQLFGLPWGGLQSSLFVPPPWLAPSPVVSVRA